jgi:DNA-directed RNA polymerase subunit RPC12/RpoP
MEASLAAGKKKYGNGADKLREYICENCGKKVLFCL